MLSVKILLGTVLLVASIVGGTILVHILIIAISTYRLVKRENDAQRLQCYDGRPKCGSDKIEPSADS